MNPGELFERYFSTSTGEIGLLAEVAIEGTTLILKDVAVFPVEALRIEIGARELVAMRNSLAREIAALGFSTLRVTGKRISGATPGRTLDITIGLERYR